MTTPYYSDDAVTLYHGGQEDLPPHAIKRRCRMRIHWLSVRVWAINVGASLLNTALDAWNGPRQIPDQRRPPAAPPQVPDLPKQREPRDVVVDEATLEAALHHAVLVLARLNGLAAMTVEDVAEVVALEELLQLPSAEVDR